MNRKYRNGKAGLPDICGYLTNGQFFCIELKFGANKAHQAQIDFIQKAKSFKAIANICYTLAEVKNTIEGAA